MYELNEYEQKIEIVHENIHKVFEIFKENTNKEYEYHSFWFKPYFSNTISLIYLNEHKIKDCFYFKYEELYDLDKLKKHILKINKINEFKNVFESL